jgi:hypothetical protein
MPSAMAENMEVATPRGMFAAPMNPKIPGSYYTYTLK